MDDEDIWLFLFCCLKVGQVRGLNSDNPLPPPEVIACAVIACAVIGMKIIRTNPYTIAIPTPLRPHLKLAVVMFHILRNIEDTDFS